MENLNEEAVDLIETYLTEDEDIADLFEDGEIDEDDILSLHEALLVLDEWDDLLEQYIPVQGSPKAPNTFPQFSKDVRTTKGARKAAREGKLKKLNPNRLQKAVSKAKGRASSAGKYVGKHKGKFGAGAAAAGIGAAAYHRYKRRKQNR